jgi:polar amino acid transport system substrate-binding protein
MRTYWLMTAILGLLLAGCAGVQSAPTQAERQALAPTGKLRAGLLSINPMHGIRDAASGEWKGVAVDLGRELARRLGVPFEVVGYPSVAAVIDSVKSGQWDIAFFGSNPARAKVMDFSPPYLEVELGYLVLGGSSISTLSDVDRPGIRISVQGKGEADRHLSTALKSAVLVRGPTVDAILELLTSGRADAMAIAKPVLFGAWEKLPGSRILEGRFSVAEYSIAVPKGQDLSAAYVRKFVADAKSEGLVKAAIERAGLRGVVVAPLQ